MNLLRRYTNAIESVVKEKSSSGDRVTVVRRAITFCRSPRRRWSARGTAQPSCSNIHAWPGTAGGRPSRWVAGLAHVAASDTDSTPYQRRAGGRKSERAERSRYRSTATDRRTDRRTDGRARRLAGPAGTCVQRGRTN